MGHDTADSLETLTTGGRSARQLAPRVAGADRRRAVSAAGRFLFGPGLGSLLIPLLGCAGPAATRATANAATPRGSEIDLPGKFEVVTGRPGIVVGVPHGTADTGTLDIGRTVCQRLGAGGVFVTGFWDGNIRQRVNVNRPTEMVVSLESQAAGEWASERAIAANAHYEALVRQAAQGPVRAFYEMHSNRHPRYTGSIEVSTLGVSRADAMRFKAAFEAARDGLDRSIPRLAIHVSPLDQVTYPSYGYASSISKFSACGCAIEHPGQFIANRAWRLAYAVCLAEAIAAAPWR